MRRITETPLGRGGRPPRLENGHRSARRPARAFPLVRACATRRPGPLPPGHLRTHRHIKETVETMNERRSRNGEKRRVFAVRRSAGCVLHPACREHAEYSALLVPAGRSRGGRQPRRLTANYLARYDFISDEAPSRSGFRHRAERPAACGPRVKTASPVRREAGPRAGHLGSRDGHDGTTPDPASVVPQGASSFIPFCGHQIGYGSSRGAPEPERLPRDPQEPAAFELVALGRPSTSGRRTPSRLRCASW